MDTAKTIRKSYKFRIYPSKSQTAKFETTLVLCRELYNAALQERRDAWKLERKSVSYFEQSKQLPEIKKIREDLKLVYSQVLQDVLARLNNSFENFFRRIKKAEKAGFPRFQNKNKYNSFTYKQEGFLLDSGKLHLSKIGKIKIKLHRDITGKVKTLTISRNTCGKWFASFSVETTEQILQPTNKSVGLDVGLTHFATLSNGETVSNPKFFRVNEKRLAKAQKNLSATVKFSKERIKRRKIVARIHERIRNRRNNFAHQLSRNIVNNFDEIFFEDLKTQNLLQNKYLSKAIADAAWNQTIEYTKYKAENAGRLFALVNPRNTSQNCSNCGIKVEKTLAVKIHDCHECGLKIDRDLNAAKNILALGLQSVRNNRKKP